MRRLFSKRQRMILLLRSGGRCEQCGTKLQTGFHADHVVPWSKSKQTITTNGAALCPACNLKKGNKMKTILRDWQKKAIGQALDCFKSGKKHFAVDAAPGTGKTMCAIYMAKELMSEGIIDRVIVIAPRNEIVRQWSKDFEKVTGKKMMKLTKTDAFELEFEDIEEHIASTWAGIRNIQDAIQAICESFRVLVIADEVHHAALEAAWGITALGGMQEATHVLALSGTRVRSDGKESIWIDEAIKANDYYEVPYREAVEEKWCVPVTFHRHHGEFSVSLDGQLAKVTNLGTQLPGGMARAVERTVAKSIRFEKLVKMPTRDAAGKPRLDSYHASMLEWASKKLELLRSKPEGEFGKPNAGALIIAPSIEMADYFAELITMKYPEEKPIVVHSMSRSSEAKIEAFRKGTKKWLVSVNMISEGVDIHRLRVLLFLPMASTELYFRQAIGRVIRKQGAPESDNSRAYVVMPELQHFVEYAESIEDEMKGHEEQEEKEKEKQKASPSFWTCNEHKDDGCGALNESRLQSCHACGMSRNPVYTTTLEEAEGWREGVIARGEEIDEQEVAESEGISGELQTAVVRSGSPRLMRILQLIPEEMYASVEEIFKEARKQQTQKR